MLNVAQAFLPAVSPTFLSAGAGAAQQARKPAIRQAGMPALSPGSAMGETREISLTLVAGFRDSRLFALKFLALFFEIPQEIHIVSSLALLARHKH